MDVSNAVREIRVKSLLSQNDFAHELGVSFSTVNRWEKGKAIPSFKALKKIKEFCIVNKINFDVDNYIASDRLTRSDNHE